MPTKSRPSFYLSFAAFTLSFLLVFFLLALAFLLLRDTSPRKTAQTGVTYLVRLSELDRRYLPVIQVGDPVTDSVTKTPLGHVTDVRILESSRELVRDGALIKLVDPSRATLILKIVSPLDGTRKTAGGVKIRAGMTLHLRLPLYTGSSLCLGFSEDPSAMTEERMPLHEKAPPKTNEA